MAVETLSPDWEFDRVDDGSQSKGAAGQGLRVDAPGPASAPAALLREGSALRSLLSRPVRDTCCPLGCERHALSNLTFGVGVPVAVGQASRGRAWRLGRRLSVGARGARSSGVRCPQPGAGRGAPGEAQQPGGAEAGLASGLAGAFATCAERSVLERAEVRVPVFAFLFFYFASNQLLEV